MAKFKGGKKNQLLTLIYRAEALSSYMLLGQGERRNKTKVSGSRKEGTKDVSTTKKKNENTYNSSSKARESKTPGGSSVRSLARMSLQASKESSRKKKKTSSQDWLNLTPHCPPPLESFDCDSFGWKVARANQKKKTTAQDAAE